MTEQAQEIRIDNHIWSKDDRMLLCTILKRLDFRFSTCKTQLELTEMNAKHSQIYDRAAEIMSSINGETFTHQQIEMQINKTNMHQHLKNCKQMQASQYEMLKCMMESDLLDHEQFYNMHFGQYILREKTINEDEIIKQAKQIQNKRKVVAIT